jgi:hypothetical protein
MLYIITIKLLDDKLYFGDQSGDLKDDSISSNSFSEILNTVNTGDFGNLFKKTGGLKRHKDDHDDDSRRIPFSMGMYEQRDDD